MNAPFAIPEGGYLRRLNTSLKQCRNAAMSISSPAKRNGVLYIGVTGNLAARVAAHRAGKGGEFTRRYNTRFLVYFEEFPTMSVKPLRERKR